MTALWAEGGGGGFAADYKKGGAASAFEHTFGVRVQRVQKVQRVQRVADCRSAAMLIKSALRDDLAVSYGIVSITTISHLRWLSPLWCLTAPPSPR